MRLPLLSKAKTCDLPQILFFAKIVIAQHIINVLQIRIYIYIPDMYIKI